MSSKHSSSRHDKERQRDKEKDRRRDDRKDEKRSNNGDTSNSGEENVAEGMEFSVNNSGEISATIEQTNRIRAKLGLKPLKVENKEEIERNQREEEERAKMEQQKSEREDKLLDTIQAMKDKRIATSIISSKSIAEEVDDEESDAMNWVERSRQMQKEKERQLAEKRAKMLDEFDEEVEETVSSGKRTTTTTTNRGRTAGGYSENDLKGLTVAHSLQELNEGEPIILTLKDTRIVEGDDVNEDEDELENIALLEREKTDKNNELRKKKKVYDVYAEAASGEKSNILSQYDDEKPKEKFVIGGEQKPPSAESALDRIRKKLANKKEPVKQEYDLSVPQSHVASEYYTQDEMVQFRKNSDSTKKKKLRKKKKSSDETDTSADRGGKKMSEILLEEAMDIETESTDRGSRKASIKAKRDAEHRQKQEQNRMKGYSKALEKAEDTARMLREDDEEEGEIKSTSIKTESNAEKSTIDIKKVDQKIPSRKAMKSDARAWLDDDDDDKEYEEDDLDTGLWKSIATSAKTSIKNPATLIASKVKTEKTASGPSGLVFSSTSEFCRNIQTTTEEVKRDKTHHELPEVKMEDAPVKIKKEKKHDDSDEEEPRDEEITSVLGEEPLVAEGLAATIAMLKRKGEIDPLATEEFVGRKTDKPVEWKLDNKGVKLEYRDNKGRLLTPKEAFRQLSHKFHGKGPSKNTIEKRERQRAEEDRKRKMASSDMPLNSVQAMHEQQSKSKLPYVMLSGNVSRSGSLATDADFDNEITEDLLAKKSYSSSSSSSSSTSEKRSAHGGDERGSKKARGK